jgi:nucleoside phosphorylase
MRSLILEDLIWSTEELDDTAKVEAVTQAALAIAPPHLRDVLGSQKLTTFAGIRKVQATVLLVAVKQPELDALKLTFGVDLRAPATRMVGDIRTWHVERDLQGGARSTTFVLTAVDFDENYEMASFCHSLFTEYDFEYAALVGMAAGLRGKVDLGDVVQATTVIDYVHAAISPDGVSRKQPKSFALDKSVARGLLNYNAIRFGWHNAFEETVDLAYSLTDAGLAELPPRDEVKPPRYHRGVVLAGDLMREDNPLPELRREFHDKTLALEMEGAGFATACDAIGWPWMVFRGIADFAEPDRPKAWQIVATIAAGTAVRCLFDHGLMFAETDAF